MSPNEPINDDRLHEVVAEVCRLVRPQPRREHRRCVRPLLYRRLAPVELNRRDPKALTAAACSLLSLAAVRAPGQPLVRVTPEGAQTVVEIVTDDMPFLVDSVEMELDRQGAHVDLLLHPVVTLRRDPEGRLQRGRRRQCAGRGLDRRGGHADRAGRPHRAGHPTAADAASAGARQVRTVSTTGSRCATRSSPPPTTWPGGEPTTATSPPPSCAGWPTTTSPLWPCATWPATQATPKPGPQGSGLGLFEAFEEPGVGGLRDDLRLGTSVLHSPVHRPDRLEFVGIRRFDEHGTCVGERQLLGLPTASEGMSRVTSRCCAARSPTSSPEPRSRPTVMTPSSCSRSSRTTRATRCCG